MPLRLRFHPPSLLIVAAFALVTWSVWAYFDQPQPEPAWPKLIQGFSFSPFHSHEDAIAGRFPTPREIDHDLALLAGRTHAVRTYTVEGSLDQVPKLAAKHNINVTLGAWVDARDDFSSQQVDKAIKLAWHHHNVVRLIVGNEVLLRGDIPKQKLFGYLDRARKEVYQPVSTAEPWDVWLKNPDLAKHVDFIAVHMLPYWEGIDVDQAVDYVIGRYQALQQQFPDKPIVIAEVGWPSNGRTRESAVATPANEALFLRRFLDQAEQRHYVYYVMEAFDQPWKAQAEGAVGAYWGVWNVNRDPKFPFQAPLVRIPHWPLLAALSVLIAIIVLVVMFFDSTTLNKRGRGFLAAVAFTAATVSVWVVYDYSQQYLSLRSVIIGLLLFTGMLGVILVLFTEAHEWVEAHWVSRRRRRFQPASRQLGEAEMPFVSIHLPAYNEPPDMLIETLDALAALDYPCFEVIVMDNNTPDPATWQPVADHCATLGSRFRFFHEKPLEGFKGGALNYALRETAPEAQIIAVIDSDYQVSPNWLHDLIPLFDDPQMGIVQAPQDYRDSEESLFKAMCYAEYRGFFYIGMITRNERNAIIQHGTMTMVRRQVLDTVGGWDEHCITEDAELGLRIFQHGAHAAYIPASYGRGLMPDTFTDYKKQRSRWAFGAIQILRRHADSLFRRRETQL
ncbi:MAG: glycosyltransferase, partial [Alcanivorax sp.]|nr:glycosyltransferase [Alcanivorax sp.]